MKKKIFIHPTFEDIFQENPLVMIDVGVSGGIPKHWGRARKYLKVIGFEPDERAFKRLDSNKRNTFFNVPLSQAGGYIVLHLTKKQENSSVYIPNFRMLEQFPDAERFKVVGSMKVNSERLSSDLLRKAGDTDYDFLKLDVRGGELYILHGASDLLESHLFGIETEVEFLPIYAGQPLFADVDKFMQQKEFQLFDLKRYYWKRNVGVDVKNEKGQIIFADALYLKTYEAYLKSMEKFDQGQKKVKILKAISICMIYGLSDYALDICLKATNDGVLSLKEKEVVFKSIYQKHKGVVFRGMHRIAHFLYKIHKYIKTTDWYYVDEEIGNL